MQAKNCVRCGAVLQEGASFCPQCGMTAEAAPANPPPTAPPGFNPASVNQTPPPPHFNPVPTNPPPSAPPNFNPPPASPTPVAPPTGYQSVGPTPASVPPVPPPAPPAPPVSEPAPVICAECGANAAPGLAFCPDCGKPLPVPVAAPVSKKKGGLPFKITPLFIGIAAGAVALIAAAIILIVVFASGSEGGNYLIYAKDRELAFTSLSNMKGFEMTERLADGSSPAAYEFLSISPYILMSEDGRYMFYPDRAGSNGATYYWRDLNADNTKSGAAVKIDSEIASPPKLNTNGSKLFYIKGSEYRLYVFDRQSGEKGRLDNNVVSFFINDAGDYIIYSTYSNGEYSVYEMTIDGIEGERTRIDSNSSIHTANANDKKVYYFKQDTLYLKESGQDKVKIASDIAQVVSVTEDGSVYYLKSEEVTNKLSDFINDDLKSKDQNIPEPVYPSIDSQPEYPWEGDYQTEVWVNSYWGNERHPETNEWGYWGYETDYEAYDEAVARYYDDYAAWEAEYIRLMESYNEALTNYQSVELRNELRTALEAAENAVTYYKYNLHYWTSDGDKLVASDLAGDYSHYLAASYSSPVVIYQKYNSADSGNQTMTELLADMGDYYYVNDIVWNMRDSLTSMRGISEEIFVASGTTESLLECEDASRFYINSDGVIYFLDDYNFERNYGTLMSADISNGTVSKPVKISEDVSEFKFGNNNSNVYYFKDARDGTGDLCLNGRTIATDVNISSLYNYKGSDTLIYFIDYSSRNENGTLCLYKDGTQTKIADDVSSFSAISEKSIAYLTEYNTSRQKGELMLYNGGNRPVLVESDVTAILWIPSMMWGNYVYHGLYY